MAGVVAGMAIMMILSLVGYQAWADMLHREMEAEMVFRAQDIVRGIQRYRRANGGVAPLDWEKLMERGPQGQYFLRQMWTDPLVPDGKWGILYVGPNGQIIDPNREPDNNGLGGLDSAFGSGRDSRNRDRRSPLNRQGGGNGPGSRNNRQNNPLGGAGNSGSFANRDGQTGLPIAGVRSLSDKTPFRIYRDLTEYEEWLFTYLDIDQPQQQQGQQQQGQQPGNAQGATSVAGRSPVQQQRPGFGGLGGAGSAGNSAQPGGQQGGVGGLGQPGSGGTNGNNGNNSSSFNQPGQPGQSEAPRRPPARRDGQGLQLRGNQNGSDGQNNNNP